MHRRANPEPELTADPSAVELQRTLNLLLPIRRQRLSRSERQQREQERALRSLVEKKAEADERLAGRRQDYQQVRRAFDGQNCGVRQEKFRLERAIQQEQQAADRVDKEQMKLHQLAQQHGEQQVKVEQAQQETRRRLREVEKLEYLLQQERFA
ncbi:type III secretion protein [Erwinia tasmaniensis]|uniref:type III secretion protein n=1 Tax=Erwinia tasmaniensis TaxID=338565 RepID=UPI003A4E6746